MLEAERATLARDLGDKDVLILRNHGLLTVGSTVAEAFYLMIEAQHACEIQIAALSGGTKLRLIDDAVQDLVHEQCYHYGGQPDGTLEWTALRRELERVAPDFAS